MRKFFLILALLCVITSNVNAGQGNAGQVEDVPLPVPYIFINATKSDILVTDRSGYPITIKADNSETPITTKGKLADVANYLEKHGCILKQLDDGNRWLKILIRSCES